MGIINKYNKNQEEIFTSTCLFMLALLSLESSDVSLDMSCVMSGQRMRRMICRGQTAAFLFVLSAKLSTRSNSFSAQSKRHTHQIHVSSPKHTDMVQLKWGFQWTNQPCPPEASGTAWWIHQDSSPPSSRKPTNPIDFF